MADPHQTHNELAREFVMKVVAQTQTRSQMMVVIESVILATLLVTTRKEGFSPRASAEFVEEAMRAALERFLEKEAPRG